MQVSAFLCLRVTDRSSLFTEIPLIVIENRNIRRTIFYSGRKYEICTYQRTNKYEWIWMNDK